MKLISSSSLTHLKGQEAYWAYCGMDSALVQEIFPELSKRLGQLEKEVYDYERLLLGPVFTMMRRGLRVDEELRSRRAKELQEQVVKYKKYLQELAFVVWEKELNLNSPKQMKDFFYGELQLPPYVKSEKGKKKIVVDEMALDSMKADYVRAMPFASIILKLKDIEKQIDVLTKTLYNGRFLYSLNIGGTTTGRFSSSSHPYWVGCVDGDTEVLTKEGWLSISRYKGEDVAVSDLNSIKFERAKLLHYPGQHPALKLESEQLKQVITYNHRVPHRSLGWKKWQVSEAKELVSRQIEVPLSAIYDEEKSNYNEFSLRLLVACLADGSLEGQSFRLSFTKRRKIDRLLWLLGQGNFSFTEQKARENYRRFSLKAEDVLLELSNDAWGSWLLSLSHKDALVILDELQYWDGHTRNNSYLFSNKNREQVEWIVTLAHLHNKSGTFRTGNNFRGYNKNSEATLTIANIKPRNHAQINPKHWQETTIDGAYCLNTSTGFFLIRKDGFISITGNSNIQNIDKRLRDIFIADEGKTFLNADLMRAEAIVVGYLSGDENYIAATLGEDVHTYVASLCWGFEPKRELADRKYYKDHTYRDLAKKLAHGSNYFGSPYTLAINAKVERSLVEEFQRKYFKAFPGIRRWQEHVAVCLQKHGYLITPLGRKRIFWNRSWEDSTIREALAYLPQSTIPDIINRGLYRLWYHHEPKLELLNQVHDSILCQVPIGQEDFYRQKMIDCCTMPVEVEDIQGVRRTMTIPLDIQQGKNWGPLIKKKDGTIINPEGLR